MEFLVLGPLEAVDGDRPVPLGSAKQRMLLAALLVHANTVVSVDRLADDLWGDAPPGDAVATVQTHVSRLRAALEHGRATGDDGRLLLTRPPGYLLSIGAEHIDAGRFEQQLRDGQRLAATGDAEGAVRLLDAALGLWRGEAFAEFADREFARTESLRLEELRRVAIDERVEANLSLGRHAELVGELEGIVATDPLRERPRGQLMLALCRSGREAEALRAYQEYREHLGAELGVEPSAELVRLEQDIIHRDPRVAWVPGPAAAGVGGQLDTRLEAAASAAPDSSATADLPAGLLTFLFTDLEGSTRLWEDHPDSMKTALAHHDAILREAIVGHRGQVVKTTGDGVYAVFEAAPDAAAAGTAALEAFATQSWGDIESLRVRMAIHTGDAEPREGDYFGPVLNRASRLMAAAHGGQLVMSAATAELVGPDLPDNLGVVDLGEHRLRGLARPERVYQLTVQGLPTQFPPLLSLDAFPAGAPGPGPSIVDDDEQLTGRSDELERLADAWRLAADGSLQIALVAGEPGIGKTRLAAEVSRRVHAEGGIVFYGRCDADAIVPYQPFVEALRDYVAASPSSVLHERLHGLERDLARVFPELLGRIRDDAVPNPGEPDTERYRLFEAVTRLVNGITVTRPVLLVLDDLHWADKPTLLLVRHLVRSARASALLVLACYRDVELVRDDHQVADLVADLARERFVTSLAMDGLSESETAALLRNVAGREMAPEVTIALHRETGGNPFFLEELLRHLIETNRVPLVDTDAPVDLGALDLPASVRDVVTRRVRRLPPVVNDVLSVGAVIGPEFDVALVAHAGSFRTEDALDALDQAAGARLVREHASRTGRYTFSHALIRQTLYSQLGTAARADHHARVAAAMESSSGTVHSAAALAQHFAEAVPLLGATKAIEYTTMAGHDALTDLAFEDAVDDFRRVLQLLEDHAPEDATRRVDVLTALASALVYVDERAGVQAALQAVDAARGHGSPEQFGRAVAVFVEPTYAAEGYPHRISALVDEARRALAEQHSDLQARLLAFEAFKYAAYQLQGRDGRALAEEAVNLARQAEDPLTTADALYALAANLEGSPAVDRRLALGEELVALGATAGGRASAFGLRVLASAHLASGDAVALTRVIAELATVGDELRWRPATVYATQWRGTQALLEGRFDDVRDSGDALRHFAHAYRGAAGMHTHQAFYLAREQGMLASMVPAGDMADEHLPGIYSRASLALAQLEAGDDERARRALDRMADADFLSGEHESAWPAGLAMLAEIAASAGAPEHAEALYERLAPFGGLLVCAVLGIACLGAADRYLGMLSSLLGHWDDAERHFDAAVETEARARGRALVPRTRYWQARFLLARGGDGDDERARALLADVAASASGLGMRRLDAQSRALLER